MTLTKKKVYLIKSGQREPETVRSARRMGLREGTADRPGKVERLGLGSLSHCRTWQWPEEEVQVTTRQDGPWTVTDTLETGGFWGQKRESSNRMLF